MKKKNYSKIILFIAGGAGNQLFQIAGAINKSNMNNKLIHISDILCKENLLNIITRFKIHEKFLETKAFKRHEETLSTYLIIFLLYVKFKFKKQKDSYVEISIFKNLYLFGYFQNKLYLDFEDSSKITKKLIPEINKRDLGLSESICIHIREGDFSNKIRLKNKYYIDSLKEIDKKLKIKINSIHILGVIGEKRKIEFISLIKSKYPLCKVNFKKNSPINDFKKLWNSKIIISSNSTFSFWAS